MNRQWLWTISLLLLLTMLPGGNLLAQPAEGACLAWDISGEWDYSASAGGYGYFRFQQDPNTGALSGTWRNRASGASGDIDSGGIVGLAVGFHPVPAETYRGTVSADGKTMQGTYTYLSSGGTWKAVGQARCTNRQPAPPSGSARVRIEWGDYVFRLALDPTTRLSGNTPQDVTRVSRINGPFGVRLVIQAIYYGDDLPGSLRVINRYDGKMEILQSLVRVGTTKDGGTIYEGTVTIPQRVLGPGEVITNEVRVENPFGGEDLITYVDQAIVDPSGYIRDLDTNEPIQGAMATAYRKEGSNWVLWNAEAWKQTNPLVSNDVGHYGWDVPLGDYKVFVTHECYEDAESPVVTVPPPRTDVHFLLKKAGCSPLKVANAWPTDQSSLPRTAYPSGGSIQFHADVTNSGTSDVKADVSWVVTDPEGQKVEALSGSGSYTIASFGAQVVIDETLPAGLADGSYRLTMQLTYQQQTTRQVTDFWVERPEESIAYLPALLKGYGSSPGPAGISGRVTYGGVAAPGAELSLRFYNGTTWSTAATTLTDTNGRYLFSSAPSLGPGQQYYVRFGLNDTDPRYLFRWDAPEISSYTAGTQMAGGDFDIANVSLVSPTSGATRSLPATFTWQARGLASDSYRWGMIELNGSRSWQSTALGNVSTFTLTGLPQNANYGQEYGWIVYVCSGPDSCGSSYYFRRVTFSAAQAQGTASSQGESVLIPEDPGLAPVLVADQDGRWAGSAE